MFLHFRKLSDLLAPSGNQEAGFSQAGWTHYGFGEFRCDGPSYRWVELSSPRQIAIETMGADIRVRSRPRITSSPGMGSSTTPKRSWFESEAISRTWRSLVRPLQFQRTHRDFPFSQPRDRVLDHAAPAVPPRWSAGCALRAAQRDQAGHRRGTRSLSSRVRRRIHRAAPGSR